MKIIDMHTHAQDILFPLDSPHVRPSRGVLIRLFEWGRYNSHSSRPFRHKLRKRIARETQARNAMASFDALIKGMERSGVTHSVVLPVEPYASSAEVLSRAEGDNRLIPFASVDPYDPRRTEKLRNCVKSGCRGLKLHPLIQDFHPAGQECFETVEEFGQYGLPVFFHCGEIPYYLPESESESYGAPGNYVKIFAAFPGVKFVMGHMGMFEAREAIEIAQVFENVYLDTSFQPIRVVRRAVERVGGDRIVFGTDWPFGGQRYGLAIIMRLTKGNPWLRERLLWKNAEELIGQA
ncbi:MAG: amidohydrolase family protein [Candidatus Hydrogenedentota bacterium]|nr:MAG: amidohydrolase family protein [Candidatus Hydrogenedentota bacterium]